jgi:hypothetical protein
MLKFGHFVRAVCSAVISYWCVKGVEACFGFLRACICGLCFEAPESVT